MQKLLQERFARMNWGHFLMIHQKNLSVWQSTFYTAMR